MKKETIITLSVEDKEALLHAANILETLSNDGRCWTAREIRSLCYKDLEHSAADKHHKIVFEW